MRTGRPSKPTELKKLLGNPGFRPLNEAEPKPRGVVRCPRWVEGRARDFWNDEAPQYIAMGVLTAADVNTFGMWCCMMADFSSDPSNYPANKTGQLRALAEHFGMTPAARARLKVDGGEDAEKDPDGPASFFAN